MDLDDEELEATREIFFCKEENSTEKLEMGEYVRTADGKIGKFVYTTSIRPNDKGFYYINHGRNEIEGYWDNEIKKHSKNIIDLIEVGDFINGYKIDYINLKYKDKKFLRSEQPYREDSTYYKDLIEKGRDYNQCLHFLEEDIETILTHEQYNKYCYKIGEEK